MSRSGWLLGVAATAVLVFSPAAPAQDRKAKSAETAIRALIDKFNASWNADNGPALVDEVLSDKAFVLARNASSDASEAVLLNKTGYLEGFRKQVWKANLRKHEHKIQALTVVGNLAYELGTITDVTAGGDERSADVLNVFAEEEAGWKLVFSTSQDLFKRGALAGQASRIEEKAERQVEIDAVRKLAREFVATFESKDPTPFERFEELLAEDVIAIQHTGEVVEGRKTLVDYYRQHTAELLAAVDESKLDWQDMSVKLMGDGAVVFGKLVISARPRQEGRPIRFEVWETLVLRKEAGRWRVLEETSTTNPVKPAPDERSGADRQARSPSH